MSISRQQRRYIERQEFKKARRRSQPVSSTESWSPRFSIGKAAALTAAVLSISVSLYFYWPRLEITGVPWDQSTGPITAKFFFRNAGNVKLSDVRFECLIKSANGPPISSSENTSITFAGKRGQIIGDLVPGSQVTRDCGANGMIAGPGFGSHPSSIRIEVGYTWPLIGYVDSATWYFVSETDGHRWWMASEKPPPK